VSGGASSPGVWQAVVLVGGRGTRLGRLTDTLPKPMLPVGGRPFLDYLLAHLGQQGVREVILSTGYLGQAVTERYADREWFGLRVTVAQEDQPAGTGGAVALIRSRLEERFFVLNGDTIFEADLQQLATQLARHPAAGGAIALREIENAARFGSVALAGERITGFNEKSADGPGLISGGAYCLRRDALGLLPPPPCSLERDLFPALAERGALVGRRFDGYFLDIGLPETLARAEAEMPGRFPIPGASACN